MRISETTLAFRHLPVLCFLLALQALLPIAAVGAGNDYLLGTGDQVKISVYDHPDLTIEARLSAAGTITFPLLGEVALGGMNTVAAENRIAGLLQAGGYIKKPIANVLITQFRSQQIAVLGQVNKPGKYSLDAPSNIIDLLALAGGVSVSGGDTVMLIKRENGNTVTREIELTSLFQPGAQTDDIHVSNGDVVFVPRAPQFYIYGEVQHPGAFRLEKTMTVMQALSVGGGLTGRGTQRGIKLRRRDATGGIETLDAKLTDLLHADDVIYVQESLF